VGCYFGMYVLLRVGDSSRLCLAWRERKSKRSSCAGLLNVKPLRRQNGQPDKNQQNHSCAHQSRRTVFPFTSPYSTTNPVPIPTRLISTCMSVYVDVVTPRIMTPHLFANEMSAKLEALHFSPLVGAQRRPAGENAPFSVHLPPTAFAPRAIFSDP
jgi:hypothetical protein